MRYLLRFSYDGTSFSGFQKQPNMRCVESELENALYNINNCTITKVVGAGRTDRGVHAYCQCAHVELDVSITPYKLKSALNSFLPSDIHVFDATEVSDDFHARYMVKKKTYKYIINCGEYNPLERNYVYQYCKHLDVGKMKQAIKDFIGKHDFKCFVSAEVKKESYEREIFDARIEEDGDKLCFYFSGTGFMKYQVRNMVGTLIRIGNNKLSDNIISEIFKDESLRNVVSTTKSEGLYLIDIEY